MQVACDWRWMCFVKECCACECARAHARVDAVVRACMCAYFGGRDYERVHVCGSKLCNCVKGPFQC